MLKASEAPTPALFHHHHKVFFPVRIMHMLLNCSFSVYSNELDDTR